MPENDNDSGDEKNQFVGNKAPPLASRFKPGQSGNPKGRPKGTRNFRTDLLEELGELVNVVVDGQEIQVTKQRAVVKALVRNAVKGDLRATLALSAMCRQSLEEEEADTDDEEEDKRILDDLIEREVQKRMATRVEDKS
jgi:hypothetical protein